MVTRNAVPRTSTAASGVTTTKLSSALSLATLAERDPASSAKRLCAVCSMSRTRDAPPSVTCVPLSKWRLASVAPLVRRSVPSASRAPRPTDSLRPSRRAVTAPVGSTRRPRLRPSLESTGPPVALRSEPWTAKAPPPTSRTTAAARSGDRSRRCRRRSRPRARSASATRAIAASRPGGISSSAPGSRMAPRSNSVASFSGSWMVMRAPPVLSSCSGTSAPAPDPPPCARAARAALERAATGLRSRSTP